MARHSFPDHFGRSLVVIALAFARAFLALCVIVIRRFPAIIIAIIVFGIGVTALRPLQTETIAGRAWPAQPSTYACAFLANACRWAHSCPPAGSFLVERCAVLDPSTIDDLRGR